jgi:hypothetical protein
MSKSPYQPSFDTFETRDLPSSGPIAPVAPLENFQNPTANIRVLDQAQQNIVGVTREGRSAIADAFFTQGMGYGWQMSKISNGQETDPGYGSNVLGKADTYGFGTEAAPEVVRVTPSFALEVINNNQLKITWSNMNTSQGACWFRCGWLGDRIVWNPEGTTTINVPNTTGDPKFDQIGVTGPWGELWTGITYRIQGGHFTQVPSSSNYTFAGWATWSRTLPNDDIGTSGIENHGGDKTIGNVTLHTNEVLVHPGKSEDVAFTWTSQAAGTASIQAILQDARAGMGDGVRYTIQRIKADGTETTTLSSGVIVDGGNLGITEGALSVAVGVGDKIKLIVCAKGTGTDPNDDKWDTIRVVKLEVKLTEAEKTYEKVTVAPSIQLRTTNNGNTLFVDYRNMPEGMKLRAMRRGIQWNDGDWGKTEVSLPAGTGSSWVSFNAWSGDISVYPVDIWLVDANSDNEPIEEKKLSFTMQGNTSSPLSGVPTTRIFVPSRDNDVLKSFGYEPTETDMAEEVAVVDYKNKLLQAPAARNWTEGQTFDARAQAEAMGIYTGTYFASGGHLIGNGGTYRVMYDLAQDKYQRHSVHSDGGAYIIRPLYMVKNDVKKLPQEFWTRLPNGDILTKPNGPRQIIYEISLLGTYTGGVNGTTDNPEELMPIEGLHISGGIQQLKAELADPQYTGFRNLITEFREASSPVLLPGTAVQLICQFESIGTVGGQITVRTTCGFTGDPNQDPVQGMDTYNFAVNGKYSLVRNVYAPSNPPTANARPIITVEVQYPDGRREILGQRLAKVATDRTFVRTDPASGKKVSTYVDYTPEDFARIQRLVRRIAERTGIPTPTFVGDTSQGRAMNPNSYYERVAQDLLRSGDPNARILGFGDQISAAIAKANRDVFVDTFTNTQLSQNSQLDEAHTAIAIEGAQSALKLYIQNPQNIPAHNALISFFIDTFGIPQAQAESRVTSLAQGQETSLQQALGWFNINESIEDLTYFVRNDTAMSRLFLGMLQEAKRNNTFENHTEIARAIENITGINMFKVLHVFERSDGNWTRILGRMKNLFTTAQFGHIFEPKPGPEQEILMAQTNKDAANAYISGEKIRVRFDMALNTSNYNHIFGYVWQNGAQVDTQHPVTGEVSGKLFFDVAVGAASKQLVASGGNIQIGLVAWVPLENQSGYRTISGLTNHMIIPEHAEFAFEPQDVIGNAQWLALTDAQKNTVRNALNFGEGIPEKNAQLLNWLVNYIRNNESLTNQNGQLKWMGQAIQDDPNDDRDNGGNWGECKYWLQTNVLKDGLGITILKNKTNNFAWDSSDSIENRTVEGEVGTNFESIVKNPEIIHSGDMIQVFGGSFVKQHTMVIGRVENDGIWVFDSNYVAKTPQYHKINFSSFNSALTQFTIYRLR